MMYLICKNFAMHTKVCYLKCHIFLYKLLIKGIILYIIILPMNHAYAHVRSLFLVRLEASVSSLIS